MSKKVRNIYIDVMKGILITLVVIGHLPYFEYDSRTLVLIYSFHMHAFLIIGGILSHVNESTKLSTIIIKRIKGILIPYFVFYIISIIFIPTSTFDLKLKAIEVMFRGIGDPNYALNLPLWFLTFYFVGMTLYEIIEWFSYRIKQLVFDENTDGQNEMFGFVSFITLCAVSIIMTVSYLYARYYRMPRIPFNVEIAGFCLGFIFIGKILGRYVPLAYNEIKKNTASTVFALIMTIIILTIFIFAWYTLSMKNGRIDLNARDYKDAGLMYIDAIIGFFIFATITFVISKIPLVKNFCGILGENSIYILAYHIPSVYFTNVLVVPYLPPVIGLTLAHNSIISILILTSFGISFSLILAFIHKSIHFIA